MKTITMIALATLSMPVLATECDDHLELISARSQVITHFGQQCLDQSSALSAECRRARLAADLLTIEDLHQARRCVRGSDVTLDTALRAQQAVDKVTPVLDAMAAKFKRALAER